MSIQYNPFLVVLSFLVAVFASYAALSLAGRVAQSHSACRPSPAWVAAGAFAMGTGIWSMHFIGMLAMTLPIATTYDLPLTAASWAIAVGISGIALCTVGGRSLTWPRLLRGAALMGGGIGAMHYVGMAALNVSIPIAHDPFVVALSLLVAGAAALAALWLAFRLRSGAGWRFVASRAGAALLMGVAIAGMHYTGMAAAGIDADAVCIGGVPIAGEGFATTLALVTATLLTSTLVVSSLDTRMQARQARFVSRLRATNRTLRRRDAARNQALRRSSAFLDSVIESIPVAVYVKDARSRRYLKMNRLGAELVGKASDALLGRKPEEAFPAEIAALVNAQDAQVLARNALVAFEPVAMPLREDARPLLRSIRTIVPDERGEPLYLLAITTDVTAEQTTRAALARKTRESEAANRAKSAFLAAVSHEIRTPMNGVLGVIDALDVAGLAPAQRARIDIIRSSSLSLLRIVDDILDYARIEAGRFELARVPVRIEQVVTEAAASLSALAEREGVSLEVHCDRGLPACVASDPDRLGQVVRTLVGNAIRFSRADGTRRGRVELVVRPSARPGQDANGRASVHLRVADNGIGMSAQTIEGLFQPFAQPRGSGHFGGTSLGLMIVRHIVHAMGGRIEVQSEPGAGATFSATLSFETIDAVEPAPTHEPAPAARLLVAEDHPINRNVLMYQLERLGHRVDLAVDGREALAMWRTSAYDVVLTDCHMPEMDGYALAAAIRAAETGTGRRTPIVAITAHATDEEAEHCLQAGMDDYLAKPLQIDRLQAVLARWGAGTAPTPGPAQPPAPARPTVGESTTAPATIDAPPQRDATPPIRRVALIDALGTGEQAILGAFFEDFRMSTAQLIGQMGVAFEDAQWAALGGMAHRLKSSAATVGADALARACSDLEQACRARQALGVTEGFRNVERCFAIADDWLAAQEH
ncbi:MAG: MHYT domain-containing protein [Lautropia sp.]